MPLSEHRRKRNSTSTGKPARGRKAESTRAQALDEVTITHPQRIVFGRLGVTKGDVAGYYGAMARWILPEIVDRPLSIIRCPAGVDQACFFQKHLAGNLGAHVRGISIRDSTGRQEYLCIDDATGLLELVQMNTIEFHPWGARADDPDRADRVVFDLDPGAGVQWAQIAAAARVVRARLEAAGLKSFVRTTGGKGLHVVVPLRPAEPWTRVRRFAGTFARAAAAAFPNQIVAKAGAENRKGRVFVDWLRNARGATSVASYSLRARAEAGVAMPVAWTQLAELNGAAAFTIANAIQHVGRRRSDPWRDIDAIAQSLPDAGSMPGD